jgi:hypothetical protein
MDDISVYMKLSKTANSINDSFTVPSDFKNFYETIGSNEVKSLVRHFIVNNVPFAFKNKPILYEQITQYIADKLEIAPTEVKLIGSAKTGFSISPLPEYGKSFGLQSDLDFSIVNEELFFKMEDEFNKWFVKYKSKQIVPFSYTEENYWNQNLDSGPRQLNNGFIDTHFIPNRDLFETTQKINNSMFLIKIHLERSHSINVKKASASIYKNWYSFAGRLNRNTKNVMKNV